MRVLHLNTERTWRGGERQTLLTAAEQGRQGVEVRLACRRDSPLESAARAKGVSTMPLPSSAPAALLALTRIIDSFDVIHCHTGRTHSLASMATVLRPKPIVVSRRVDFVPNSSAFNRWKYRRASKVVCVSKWIGKVMQEWGLPEDKMTVIYEAVPGGAYLPRESARKRLEALTGISLNQRIVGNIAALVGHKDQATLLRAARRIADQHPDVVFIIIGDGELKTDLLNLREELGLAGKVHFTGFIHQAQELLPGFDVFAMSSRMEGLGTIVLDAGLAGVPVATTAGGGLPEAVLHNQTGLVVPVGDASALADAVWRLLSDPALADRLGTAAQERIRNDFSVPNMAQSYLNQYRGVLGLIPGTAPAPLPNPLS